MKLGETFALAGISSLFFILLSHPYSYHLTNVIFNTYEKDTDCPTNYGHLFHTFLFFLVGLTIKVIFNMNKYSYDRDSYAVMFKLALYCTLLFFTLSGSDTYELTGRLSGNVLAKNGCASGWGVVAHGMFYFILSIVMALLPNKCD